MAKICIVGSGFSGLSSACYLSKAGHEVHVFEKNLSIGGRARQFETENGYKFDMGPSWYWMPNVFENFFKDFNVAVEDLYDLKLLDPSFDIVFPENEKISIPENFEKLCELFEGIEAGSSKKLLEFLDEAAYKYKIGMEKLIYSPGISILEFLDLEVIKGVFKLQVFTKFSTHVRKYFSNPKLIALMEFPILFLGAMPNNTPALYSLMNFAALKLGTWYPIGGFIKVIEAMESIAKIYKTQFHLNSAIEKIQIESGKVQSLLVNGKQISCDVVIASADYHHIETKLIDAKYRNYSDKYWENRFLAPSCLIFYIGINTRIENINHHTLFFDEDLDQHAKDIYEQKRWPKKPLFYVCCPSRTDVDVAPIGHENLFLLMPIATNLEEDEELKESYFNLMVLRIKKQFGINIKNHLEYKKSYCVKDFKMDYNSFKGNAYGLANTLNQTAIFKPKIINKKVKNLFYTGQLTVPGPGVPPSIISGKIVANQVLKTLK
ncbi:MAG: phytoene desaturase family protein [Bacteroidota bacterium]